MDSRKQVASIQKWLTIRRLLNGLFYAAVLNLLFNPAAKALLIRGLMDIGFFQPEIPVTTKTVKTVSDITFKDVEGSELRLSSLKGKVVFINFWATWCPPCIAELPAINRLHQDLKADTSIIFLLADADNDFKKSVPFLLNHQYHLPLYEATSVIPEAVMGNTIPTTVVINKTGQLVFRHEGAADYTSKKFVNYLKDLAAE